MLIAAAVCPHPPSLLPEVAAGAAAELAGLRAACDEAVRRLIAAAPETIVVVGGDRRTRAYHGDPAGTLRPYGVDLTIGRGTPELPLSLTIGRWLLERAGAELPVRYRSVASAAAPAECLRLGADVVAGPRTALLVMGDGAACRTEKAPGYLDSRAEAFDRAVARMLATGDADGLARLDPILAEALLAAGRPAWQVLAGAARAHLRVGGPAEPADAGSATTAKPSPAARPPGGPEVRPGDGGTPDNSFAAALLADEAPYGVGYFVASWVSTS